MDNIFRPTDNDIADRSEWQGLMVDAMAYTTMGDFIAASQTYRKALAVAQRQAAEDPTDTTKLFMLAMSHRAIARMLDELGDHAGSEKALRHRLRACKRLMALAPSDTVAAAELIAAHVDFADACVAQGDHSGALREYEAAHEVGEHAAALDLTGTAHSYGLWLVKGRMGRLRYSLDDTTKGMTDLSDALALAERMAAENPDDEDWLHALATSREQVSITLAEAGDRAEALSQCETAAEIRQRLLARDTSDPERQRALARNRLVAGRLLRELDDLDGALKLFRKALTLYRQLQKQYPPSDVMTADVCMIQHIIGDTLEQQGQQHKAMRAYRDTLDDIEQMARRHPGEPTRWGSLLFGYRRLSEIAEPLNPAEARRWCKAGMDRLAELEQAQLPVDTDEKTRLIALAARLGLSEPPPAAPDAQS